MKAHDEAVSGMVGQLEVCACGHNRCMHRGVQGHAQCTQKSCRCYLFRNPAPDPLSCGASDGEMGDENWVYEYTGDHLAVSVPSKHDPLWSVAWSNGERIGEGASQPLMWADARHRLTPEAAAVTAPDLKAQDKTPTAAECDAFVQRSLGNAYWNKDRVTVDELAIARYAIEQIRKQSELASLAKKLASAIEHAVWQLDETDTNPGDACDDLRTVLAEAKKAGCA